MRPEAEIEALARDPLYGPLWRRTDSLRACEDAGWLWTGLSATDTEELLTAAAAPPAIERLSSDPDAVALLSSGCYGPAHQGHLQMMLCARDVCEREWGLRVELGWMLPSHSSHALTKTHALSDEERLRSLKELIKPHPWLVADEWVMRGDRDLNFSTQIERAERFGARVVYVYGADNGDFGAVFNSQRLGVCVEREGFSARRGGAAVAEHPQPSRRLSSSQLREAQRGAQR